MASYMKCSICERAKKIAPSRPANPLRAREVGKVLALVFSYHVSSDNQRLMVLNLIDEASKFHIAKVVRTSKTARTFQDLGNCESKTLLICLDEYTRYLSTPRIIHCDDEGIFSSDEFKEWCNQRTIQIRPCVGEAHWQNGIVERHIGTLKNDHSETLLG